MLSTSAQTSLMTFNIRYANSGDKENSWDNRKVEVCEFLDKIHPDIFGVQEAIQRQVNYILDNTSNYQFIGVGRTDGKTKGEYSAIFYDTLKFELLKDETFWLSTNPDEPSVGWDAVLKRICTYGQFKNKKTHDTIHVFNTHFDHIGSKARKNSAALILAKISAYQLINKKVIVMGDFNSKPHKSPIILLKKHLLDGRKVMKRKFRYPEGSFNAFNVNSKCKRRIDYIFTRNLTVLNYIHMTNKRGNGLWLSDHLPVKVEVE